MHRLLAALALLGASVLVSVPPARAALVATGIADNLTVSHDHTLSAAKPGVLGNDLNLLGNTTAILVSGVSHGSLTLRSDGGYTYIPDSGFIGTDSFRYRPSGLLSTAATATIAVTNAAPVARGDAYSGTERTTLTVPAPGVLANDTDADGDSLVAQLSGGGISGSLDLDSNGGFRYSPGGGVSGTVSFNYRVWDGFAWSSLATVTLTINPAATPTPRPTPIPTPRPTPTPTPRPIPSLPLPSLPLPSLPLPGGGPGASQPVPSIPVSLQPNPSTPPSSGLPSPADPRPTPSAGPITPGGGVGPGASPGGGVGPGDGSGGGFPATGPDGLGGLSLGSGRDLNLGLGLGDLLGSLDVWAVPAATIGVSGLLVILFVALQAGGTLIWVPAVRRLRGERRAGTPVRR
jgi:hypothetical protein